MANSGDEGAQKIYRERISLLDRFIRARIGEGHREEEKEAGPSSWARESSPASSGQPIATINTSFGINTRDTARGNARADGVLREEDIQNLSEEEQLRIAIERSKVIVASIYYPNF